MESDYHFHLLVVLLMVLGNCSLGPPPDCPRLCDCRWKDSKETVTCVNANYSTIPNDLDSGTQILNLSLNNLMRLREDAFSNVGLINLQRIYLVKCRLRFIDKYTFRNLINLVGLDLSRNYLTTVPSYIFHSMPELREIKVNENPIIRIPNRSFVDIPKIVRIEFSNCKIDIIDEEAFEGIQNSLHWLKLDGNLLKEVKAVSFTSLGTLHGLELAGNPLNCTCNLRPFYEWIIRTNIPFEIPPTCRTPKRLASKRFKDLDLDEFACVPHIKALKPKKQGVEGSNITLICEINGVPEPHIRWFLKNRIIANRTHVLYSIGKKQFIVNNKNNLSNLTIQTVDVQDAGVYTCSAENKAGKSESSVTLNVSRKTSDNFSESRAIIAGAAIAVTLVSFATLLVVCVFLIRRRRQRGIRWQGRRTVNRTCDDNNYEKIEMSKLTGDHSTTDPPIASVAVGVSSVLGPTRRNGEYRVVPSMDTDQEIEEEDASYEDNLETPTPTNVNRSRDTKLWAAAASGRSISSPNSGHWNSNVCDSNFDPDDLHIPRRTKEQTGGGTSKTQNSIYGTYKDSCHSSKKSHRILPNIPQSIQPALMKKQILPNKCTLYSSIPVSSELIKQSLTNPELEENKDPFENVISGFQGAEAEERSNRLLNKHTENTSDSLYCTLPRQTVARGQSGTRYRSCDSESPLLPRSRFGSSGGDSSSSSRISSRRFSEDSLKSSHRTKYSSNLNLRCSSNSSLASSRQNLFVSNKSSCEITPPESTLLLNAGTLGGNILSPSLNIPVPSSRKSPFSERAHKLEEFLEGYRNVQYQLSTMKEMCDQIKQQQQQEKQLRASLFVDPLLLSDCQDYNPKSILKKPVSTVSSSIFSRQESPSTSADWTSDRSNSFESNKRYY